jgi:hypothetical protein
MIARQNDLAPIHPHNAATRTVASSLGVLLGISSIDHGVLEVMQGNVSTSGAFVKALGPGHSWTLWIHGGEPAFTLVHNFLLTGTLATVMGILLIVWSAGFIERRCGPTVFLLISIASFITGGGQAQVLLFTLNWAAATRIHAPLGTWKKILPGLLRRILARVWRLALISTVVLFLGALEIATIGFFPGLPHSTEALTRTLWRLAAAIIATVLLTIFAGFAHDLEVRDMGSRCHRHDSPQSVVQRG